MYIILYPTHTVYIKSAHNLKDCHNIYINLAKAFPEGERERERREDIKKKEEKEIPMSIQHTQKR